jgi:hypothetical protein
MSRTKSGTPPSYRLHKSTGQARVRLPDGQGGRRDYYLGLYGSEESIAAYTRRIHQWRETQRLPDSTKGPEWMIHEVMIRFFHHA